MCVCVCVRVDPCRKRWAVGARARGCMCVRFCMSTLGEGEQLRAWVQAQARARACIMWSLLARERAPPTCSQRSSKPSASRSSLRNDCVGMRSSRHIIIELLTVSNDLLRASRLTSIARKKTARILWPPLTPQHFFCGVFFLFYFNIFFSKILLPG
jgi:hypothetical protein